MIAIWILAAVLALAILVLGVSALRMAALVARDERRGLIPTADPEPATPPKEAQ